MNPARNGCVLLLGVPIDNITLDETLEIIDNWVREGGFHQAATANIDFLMKSIVDDELRETLCRCDLVIADGMPLVWASRAMGTPLPQRVAGSDLVPRIAEAAAARGYRIFLLGAAREVSKAAADWMVERFPGLKIAGRYSPPPRDLDHLDHEEILRRIEACDPDILLVAFGNPKQEKWIAMHRNRLTVPVCIGIGGTLDFLSGRFRRAPAWMQAAGLEWFYRLSQEPRRLASRYMKNLIGAVRYLPPQVSATLFQQRCTSPTQIARRFDSSHLTFQIEGDLTAGALRRCEMQMVRAIDSGFPIVLDLDHASYVGADALGSLVRLRSIARRQNLDVWLTGIRPSLYRLLQVARIEDMFRFAPKSSDATRRIQSERLTIRVAAEESCFSVDLGGQMIYLAPQDALAVHRQLQSAIERGSFGERISSIA